MGQELEIKLRLNSAAQIPQLLGWQALAELRCGEPEQIRMQTTYYDTPMRHLSRRKWTLRCRQENDKSVVTLKTPGRSIAGMKVRGEWEIEAGNVAAALPTLVALGAPSELTELFASCAPQPVCGARFLRRAQLLRFQDGSTCELACDEGVLLGGGRELALCEAELELKSGARACMVELGKRLMEEFSICIEPNSKFSRAAALAMQKEL